MIGAAVRALRTEPASQTLSAFSEMSIEKPVQAVRCIIRRRAVVLQPVFKHRPAGLEILVVESMIGAGIDNELNRRPGVAPAGDFIGTRRRRVQSSSAPMKMSVGISGRAMATLQGG